MNECKESLEKTGPRQNGVSLFVPNDHFDLPSADNCISGMGKPQRNDKRKKITLSKALKSLTMYVISSQSVLQFYA